MAINTTKATIQVRGGNEADFDPDKMAPREWAVSLDKKYVRMCFAPGLCLRMATYESFEEDMEEIRTILATCQDIQAAVERFEQLALEHQNQAEYYSKISESWAVGGTGEREGEDENNSQYYCERSSDHADMSRSWAVGEGGLRPDEAINNSKYFAEQAAKIVSAGASGALIPMGTIPFDELPLYAMETGQMYNISTDFTSDERFEDGGGIFYNSGANVYYTAGQKWDVLAGTQVTGVKGSAEETYRVGNVNITPENIGLGNVDNTADSEKNVAMAAEAEKLQTARKINGTPFDGTEDLRLKSSYSLEIPYGESEGYVGFARITGEGTPVSAAYKTAQITLLVVIESAENSMYFHSERRPSSAYLVTCTASKSSIMNVVELSHPESGVTVNFGNWKGAGSYTFCGVQCENAAIYITNIGNRLEANTVIGKLYNSAEKPAGWFDAEKRTLQTTSEADEKYAFKNFYGAYSDFPAEGDPSILYMDTFFGKGDIGIYRWDGRQYVNSINNTGRRSESIFDGSRKVQKLYGVDVGTYGKGFVDGITFRISKEKITSYPFIKGKTYEIILEELTIDPVISAFNATYEGTAGGPYNCTLENIEAKNEPKYTITIGNSDGYEPISPSTGVYSKIIHFSDPNNDHEVEFSLEVEFPFSFTVSEVASGEFLSGGWISADIQATVNVEINFSIRDVTGTDPKMLEKPYELYGYRVDMQDPNPQTRISYLAMAKEKRPAFWNYVNGYFDAGDWGDAFFLRDLAPCMVYHDGGRIGWLDRENYQLYEGGSGSDITMKDNGTNAMVLFPTIWTKRWQDENYQYCLICDKKLDSGFRAYMHTRPDGKIAKEKGIGMYLSTLYTDTDGVAEYRSLSSATVSTNKSYAQELETIEAMGDSWSMFSVSDWATINDLLRLISRSDDFQRTFGYGLVGNGNAANNNTDPGKLYYGGPFYNSAALNTNSHQKVFHLHQLYGDYYTRIAGLVYNKGKMFVEPTPPYTMDGSAGEDTGITITGTSDSYCKVSKMTEYGRFPVTLGGSDSTYECDAVSYSNTIIAIATTRGVYNAAKRAGTMGLYLGNAGTANGNIATRLTCFFD